MPAMTTASSWALVGYECFSPMISSAEAATPSLPSIAFIPGLGASLIGDHRTNFSASNFFLGTKPVFEFAAFFPPAGLIKFVCSATDLLGNVRIGDYFHLRLSGRICWHGGAPFWNEE